MKVFLSVLLVATAASALSETERSRLALENPDLFEGDILGFDPDDRNVISREKLRWTNGVIPYEIADSLLPHTELILSAMDDFHKNTCLKFVPRTNHTNYIKFFKGRGCYTYVGMVVTKGEQAVSLGDGCYSRGTIVHELGHVIGFFHEHSRSDRDAYLVIYWSNISWGNQIQFALLAPYQNLLLTPFDYDSIMLYGNYAFSKDGVSKTIEARNGQRLVDPEMKNGMSISDIRRVNKMYKC